MPDDDRSPLTRAAHWLTTVRITLAFGTVLSTVFLVELWVWERFGFETFAWLFVADRAPSPAWVFSTLAHSPLRPVHLVGNLALLIVFGGMTERRLGRREYVGFLVVAGLASTFGQALVTGTQPASRGAVGSLGASGATLAAAAYAVVASVRTKLTTGEWDGETTPIWVVAGGAIVARRLALDLAVGVPGVGRFGHLWGVLFGVGYALARSGFGDVTDGE